MFLKANRVCLLSINSVQTYKKQSSQKKSQSRKKLAFPIEENNWVWVLKIAVAFFSVLL